MALIGQSLLSPNYGNQNLVSIDGKYYNIFIPENGIKRTFAVTDTQESGRVQTGEMIRDIIGTFYNYTITFNTNFLDELEYDDLYMTLSTPVDYHTIIVPWGAKDLLAFKAYVTNGEDTMRSSGITQNGYNKWHELSINFIAMKPQIIPDGDGGYIWQLD